MTDTIIIYVYLLILGSCIASFINVVIYRLPLGENIAAGRSKCGNCDNTIKFYDLIPVFSYVILKGKCRYCKSPIGIIHPIIELIGGLFAIGCFFRFGISVETPVVFMAGMILLAISVIDFRTMTIPNELVVALIIPAVAMAVLHPEVSLLSRLIGAVMVPGIMIVTNLIVSSSFGGGDIKLMFVAGFMLGLANSLLASFIGVVVAGIYAIYLIYSHKTTIKAHIAFGPYLCLGIIISLFYGSQIIAWYLGMFQI